MISDDFTQLMINISFDISNVEYSCTNVGVHHNYGPAIIYDSGAKYWYVYGMWHNGSGSTAITSDGSKAWWVDGVFIKEEHIF